ncbi:ABC transporter substrate-binding protein [Acidianus sulfidivorans JP7]|uniref:ABC transporter substrate-binding protein n=1 Tax=Acidianus sulfidivorans JP7 TaxID=619593 RepID=A0A2U9ILV9_9CREN|nr:ABC transporter substrate-binding protein [Acidianus sulfidivorans]AWR96997.1 ABC transporter substrate-binding protein [Acidianus sulfidivorans JP7]
MVKIYNEILDDYIEVKHPLQKIVSLDPPTTETLFLIGLGDRIIATDAFSYRPEEARKLPKIGSYTHVKLDFLEKEKPDLIFTTMGAQKDLTKKLLNQGYTVYPLPVATSVSKIIDNVIIVGEVTNSHSASTELVYKLRQKIIENISPPKNIKIYVEFDLGGPITAGFPTHLNDAINIIGGKNIFEDKNEAYFTPIDEEILQRDPDIFIYEPKRLSEYEKERFLKLLKKRGLEKFSQKIIYTRGDYLAHLGPSFILDSIPWLRSLLPG